MCPTLETRSTPALTVHYWQYTTGSTLALHQHCTLHAELKRALAYSHDTVAVAAC